MWLGLSPAHKVVFTERVYKHVVLHCNNAIFKPANSQYLRKYEYQVADLMLLQQHLEDISVPVLPLGGKQLFSHVD